MRTVVYPVTNISRASFGRATLMKQYLHLLKTLLNLEHINKQVFQRCKRVYRCVGSTSVFWQGTTQASVKTQRRVTKCMLTTSNVSLHQSRAKSSGWYSVFQASCGTKPALCCVFPPLPETKSPLFMVQQVRNSFTMTLTVKSDDRRAPWRHGSS